MKKLEIFIPLAKPYFISQYFGENKIPLYKELGMLGHNGWDIVCPLGKPIYASHDGQVVYAGQDGKEGIGVVIRTNEQFLDNVGSAFYFKTLYWHLLPNVPVKVGQRVNIGDLIGYADTTGYATGPHLHWGLKPQYQGENEWTWWNSESQNGYKGAIDPVPYIQKLTAYEIRTLLYQMIPELLQKIAEQVALLFKRRK
ncbi:MAG: M23 family metallopeptidase [Planctomycetota bacterium]|nr:M23 family metallopeptidase [Planctomycetota bacterium]